MKVTWIVSDEDVQRVQKFVDCWRQDTLVLDRAKNLTPRPSPVSRSDFWREMVYCLLTTQQRSGPDAPTSRFMKSDPFPLSYEFCRSSGDAAVLAGRVLSTFGGLRRFNLIAAEIKENLAWLEAGNWPEVEQQLDALRRCDSAAAERQTARFIADHLKGVGPKQSRNLLQGLGLTRYEIPLDSRVTKRLKEFGFPFPLSSLVLSDPDAYDFILDGVQELCRQCGVLPCMLDAAMFASFDGGEPET